MADACAICFNAFQEGRVAVICSRMHTVCWDCFGPIFEQRRCGGACPHCRQPMFPSRHQHCYPETLPPGPPPPVIDLTRKRRRTVEEVESDIDEYYQGDPIEWAFQLNRYRWRKRRRNSRRRLNDSDFAEWLELNPSPVRIHLLVL